MNKKLASFLTGTFLASCAVSFVPTIATAQEQTQSQTQTQSEDYSSMPMAALQKLAKKKDVKAMKALALKYQELNKPYEAAQWFKKAAEEGDLGSQYFYGVMLLQGTGVERNIKDGYKYISQAAADGDSNAMIKMADFYSNGLVIRGSDWRHILEELVSRDPEQEKKWLRKAVDAGNPTALGKLLQITTGEERFQILQLAAEAGDEDALTELGSYYADPDSDQYDYEKAKGYFTRANNQSALSRLEQINNQYLEHQAKIEAEQKEWDALMAKAEGGDINAMNEVGNRYNNAEQYENAEKWFRRAADKGSGSAAYNLGELYYYGLGMTKDRNEAFKWYKKAEANGMANDAYTLYTLGYMYSRGEGTAANVSLARTYLNKAIKAGYNEAQKELDNIEKRQIMTRKTTSFRVLNHVYVGNVEGAQTGVRFDPNGKLVITVYAYGNRVTRTGWWRQNGTEITTNIGTLWLDSKGNLHEYPRSGHMIWKLHK